MNPKRFEDTPAWQDAMRLGDRIVTLLEHAYFRTRRGLADQLDRAAVSISNNIAEGFERGTTPALITFLYYAKGSAGEVRSMLHGLAKRATNPECPIQDSRVEIQELIRLSESISRQLHGWADYLQNTELQGVRHVNDQTRAADERSRRRRELLDQLERLAPKRTEPDPEPSQPPKPISGPSPDA